MKSSFLSLVKFLVGWPLSLVALFFIAKVTSANLPAIVSSIEHMDVWLFFWGVVCFVFYFFLRGYIWQQLLKEQGYILSLAEVSYLWSISEIKRYIPGNIWSFLSRTVLFSEKKVSKQAIVSGLFSEAQLVFLGALTLTSFALPFSSYLIPQLQLFSWAFPLAYTFSVVLCLFYIFGKSLTSQLSTKDKPYFKFILPQFSPLVNSKQLLLSFLSFLIFGLGSYFVGTSIAYLSPEQIVGFIFFFIFSYFVGYISLITPMGLGVREGVITVGLAHIATQALSATVAIFLRIVFILSELLAMVLAFVWFKNTNRFIGKCEQFINIYKYECVLIIAICIYIFYFATASFLRFDNFFTGRFDLGNMDQTVWNTLHGRIFMFTNPDGTEVLSRLAFHADFILVLIAPFYTIWRDPRMLLLLQTIILGFGALFVYAISQKIVKTKSLSLTLAIVYLLNPSLEYTNLYDFHAVTFATTFLLATYYFAITKRYKLFFVFAILAGLCKEEIWLIIALFGGYFFFIQKKRILGITVFTFFLLLTYYIISILIPHTRGDSHFALSYYADFGDSPLNIIKTILFSPQKVITILLEPSRLNYLKQLFLPVGFLSLFAPFIFIFAAPDLLINILSSNNNLHQIYYQYTAAVTPFIFIAAIYGMNHLRKKFYLRNGFLIVYLCCMAIISAYFIGPLPGAKNPNIDMFTKRASDRKFIAEYLATIPRQYSVAATNNIGAQLSHRPYLFTIPTGMDKADVIAFLLGDSFAQPSPQEQEVMVAKLKNNPNYILRVEQGRFYVFEKRTSL